MGSTRCDRYGWACRPLALPLIGEAAHTLVGYTRVQTSRRVGPGQLFSPPGRSSRHGFSFTGYRPLQRLLSFGRVGLRRRSRRAAIAEQYLCWVRHVPRDAFLAGYGAAQAVPGPLFTFAAYLGAIAQSSSSGLAGALLGVIGIFLPGMLVLIGTLPFWDLFRQRTDAQAAMRGINAAVVGLLGAALYNPLWTSTVKSPIDLAIALACFILLIAWRVPPLVVVILGAVGSVLLS
jgi:chromate transport protein ChrA